MGTIATNASSNGRTNGRSNGNSNGRSSIGPSKARAHDGNGTNGDGTTKQHRSRHISKRSVLVKAIGCLLVTSVICNVWSLMRLFALSQRDDGANEIHSIVNQHAKRGLSGAINATVAIMDDSNQNAQEMQQQRTEPKNQSLPDYQAALHKIYQQQQQQQQQQQTPEEHLVARSNKNEPGRNNRRNHTRKLPQLILHLGPAKTATTTLQIDMRHLNEKRILPKERIAYWGIGQLHARFRIQDLETVEALWNKTCMHRHYAKYMEEKRSLKEANRANPHKEMKLPSSIPVPQCLRRTKKMMKILKGYHINLILSNELFSTAEYYEHGGLYDDVAYFDHFKDFWKGWNVTVVVTYRRFAEWILSSVKQFNMQTTQYEQKPCKKWPIDGGSVHNRTWTTVQGWMADSAESKNMYRHEMMVAYIWVYMDGVIRNWRSAGFNTHIMNVHSKRQITEQFMCDFIQDAPESCSTLKSRTEETNHNVRNMAFSAYNDIIFTAAQRGVISNFTQQNAHRLKQTEKLAEYHGSQLNLTLADLPLICPKEEELQKLLDISLALEKKWMPQWHATPQGEAAHRASFDRIARKKREFCTVDMDKLFANVRTWDGLLEEMKRTTWD